VPIALRIVLGNLAVLFGITLYTFWPGRRAAGTGVGLDLNLHAEAFIAGALWIVFVLVAAIFVALCGSLNKEARAHIKPYGLGLWLSIPALLLGWGPAFILGMRLNVMLDLT